MKDRATLRRTRGNRAPPRSVVTSDGVRKLVLPAVVVVVVAACSSSSPRRASPTTTVEPATTTLVTGPVVLTSEQAVYPLYTQGVARIPNGWIFSGNNWLYKTDDALHIVKNNSPAIPSSLEKQGYVHVGDIDVVGNYIYAPLEQPYYEKGTQVTARYTVDGLKFVDAVVLHQHENSFVTIDPGSMIAYTMDRFDGESLLRYDVAHEWKPLPPLRLSMLLHRTQGGDIAAGAIWISTDDNSHGIYRVDLATGATTMVGAMGHPGGEGEGIDATPLPSGLLHTLTVAPSHNPVYFAHWRARTS
jgi:hypothetical protein